MTIILRMQQLPWSATSMDIRRYFTGLSIPDGGVHIVGGEAGDVFIAFSSDEDARRAMQIQNRPLCGNKIALMLSSKNEMQEIIAHNRAVAQVKSDPFQHGGLSQNPAPPNQPTMQSVGDSLNPTRDLEGFKDPLVSQYITKLTLPNELGLALGQTSQIGELPLGGSPGKISDLISGYGRKRDDVPQNEQREPEGIQRGTPMRRGAPSDAGPFVGDKDMQFTDQPRGSAFRNPEEFQRNTEGSGDMDSRIPSERRPPLLHEPGRPSRFQQGLDDHSKTSRPPYGLYGEGEDDRRNKRFKMGAEHSPPTRSFDQGLPHLKEGLLGDPNQPQERFGDKNWDRPFDRPEPGFQDNLRENEYLGNSGPSDHRSRFGLGDQGNQRNPMFEDDSFYGPEGRRNPKDLGVEGGRYPGDPFGLNDPFSVDDPRGSSSVREKGGPEDYKRNSGPFDANDRDRKSAGGQRDRRHPSNMGPGGMLGSENRMSTRDYSRESSSASSVEPRGSSGRMGPDDRKYPADHMGLESLMGPGDRRAPDDRMGPSGRWGPGDHMGVEGRMSPNGHMSRGGRMGVDDNGPGRRMGVDDNGPGRRMGPDGVHGFVDQRGHNDRKSLEGHMGMGDRMGDRIGDRMGDRMGDRLGPGDHMDQGDRIDPDSPMGPGGLMGPGSHRGPPDEHTRFDDRMGPVGDIGTRGLMDPGDYLGLDGQMGHDDRRGLRGRMGPGEFRDLGDSLGTKGPSDFRGSTEYGDQMGQRGPNDRTDQRRRPGPEGQWEPVRNVGPGRLGPDGRFEPEERFGPRGPGGSREYQEFGSRDYMEPGKRRMDLEKREANATERPFEERHGPRDRMGKDEFMRSREGEGPDNRFQRQSRFSPAEGPIRQGILGPGGPSAFGEMDDQARRGDDMRRGERGTPGPYLDAPKLPSLLDGKLPLSKRSEERDQPHDRRSGDDCCVRILGMPFNVTVADVVNFFSGIRIADNGIRFNVDNLTNKPNGNAFIKFASGEDATKACRLNRKYMGNRYVEVSRCKEYDWNSAKGYKVPPEALPSKVEKQGIHRSRSRSPIRSACVEVKGIPHHTEIHDIKSLFYGMGLSNDKIVILSSSDNTSSGNAFAEFPDQLSFEKALRKRDLYIGRHSVDIRPISKEVMNARILDYKKRNTDKQTSNRLSSSTRDSKDSSSRSKSSSSRDTRNSGARDRDTRESSTRDKSSRDQDSRQSSSKHSRDNQRSSDKEPKSRDQDSRQSTPRSKDNKETGSRVSDSRSRYSGESSSQKHDSDSKDQDTRKSGSSSKSSQRDSDQKNLESSSKMTSSQQDIKSQPDQSGHILKNVTPKKESPKPDLITPAENPIPGNEIKEMNPDEKCCIHMRNMPYNTSEDEIHRFFDEMKLRPRMVHFLITPDRRPNGQAYVEFANAADAHKAVAKTEARIQDRSILMGILTRGHLEECLAQGRPPQPTQGPSGMPRGPSFHHRPPMDYRPPLLNTPDVRRDGPQFGMRGPPMRGPRPSLPPVEVLIARRCVVGASNLPFDIPIPAIIDFFSNHNVVPESVRLKTTERGRTTGEAMVAFRTAGDANRAIADLNGSIIKGRTLRLHLMKP